MGSTARIRIVRGSTFELLVYTADEPDSLPDRQGIGLMICEAHVVHQDEDLFEEDLFVSRCQAKKTKRPLGAVPPMTPYSWDSPSTASYQFQVRAYQRAIAVPGNPGRACHG